MSARLLDANTTALSNIARQAGEACARKLFAHRGNHGEAHLSEYELALACACAAEVAMRQAAKEAPSNAACPDCAGLGATATTQTGAVVHYCGCDA